MSYELEHAAARVPDLPPYERVLLLMMARVTETDRCWATNEYLAEMCVMSVRQVSRARQSLVDRGLICLDRPAHGGTGKDRFRGPEYLFDLGVDCQAIPSVGVDSQSSPNGLGVDSQSVRGGLTVRRSNEDKKRHKEIRPDTPVRENGKTSSRGAPKTPPPIAVLPTLTIQHEAPNPTADLWDIASGKIAGMMNANNFNTYVAELKPISWDGKTFTLAAPSKFIREACVDRMHGLLRRGLGDALDADAPNLRVVLAS